MKKFIIALLFSCLVSGVFAQNLKKGSGGWLGGDGKYNVSRNLAEIQNDIMVDAFTAYPVPKVDNFLERKIITDWAERWDVPNKPCYCYVFVGEKCIGYFVTNGKPASTQSYLIPEEIDIYFTSGASTHEMMQSPDIDGTFGDNNPGYRMFLASGQAIEVSGYNMSMIYSDSPVPALSQTCLGK